MSADLHPDTDTLTAELSMLEVDNPIILQAKCDLPVVCPHTGGHPRFRVSAFRDEDAESPRDSYSNITTMITWDRDYNSPDNVTAPPFPRDFLSGAPGWSSRSGYGLDVRRVTRYLHLFGNPSRLDSDAPETPDDVLAFAFLYRDGSGGLMVDFGGETTTGNITNPALPFGWANVGDQADGIVFITRKGWEECMGNSPIEGGAWPLDAQGTPFEEGDPAATLSRTPSAAEVMKQEADLYNAWQDGSFVDATIDQEVSWVREMEPGQQGYQPGEQVKHHTWEYLDSLAGFESIESARDWALEQAENLGLEGE